MTRRLARVLVFLAMVIPLMATPPTHVQGAEQASDRPPGTSGAAPEAEVPATWDLAGAAAFVIEVVEFYPDTRLHYVPDVATADEWIYVDDGGTSSYYVGDFRGRDYTKLYVIDDALKQLHTFDTRTGATTVIGSCNSVSGHIWAGLTSTPDGVLYAVSVSTDGSSSYLYTVNPSSGAATVVGQVTNANAIAGIAVNVDGELYGLDVGTTIGNGNLVRINPATAAGTVVGPIGYDAELVVHGLDFDDVSGILYLAAYDHTWGPDLRTVNISTGATTVVDDFPNGTQVAVLALTPPPAQYLGNPGFESGWQSWSTADNPALSSTYRHSGTWSVRQGGETTTVWQPVYIPSDAIEVTLGYWLTGVSSDTDWDNDIFCGTISDLTWQTTYADACFGMTYFYSSPGVWRYRTARLSAAEVASIAGRVVNVAFQLTQDWLPGYHKTSTAYVDDVMLLVTRPVYDYGVFLPLAMR